MCNHSIFLVQFGIYYTLEFFKKLKLHSACGLEQFWYFLKNSLVQLIPNWTRMITYTYFVQKGITLKDSPCEVLQALSWLYGVKKRAWYSILIHRIESHNCWLLRLNLLRSRSADLMLGKTPTEDLAALIATMRNGAGDEDQWTMEREECVAQLVVDCQLLLVTENDEYLGGWALVDPFCT